MKNTAQYTQDEQKALKMLKKGKKPFISTFIDEDTIIMGFGKLDYDFEFPLPKDEIIKRFGTTSWAQRLYNEGYRKYKITNKITKEVDLLTLHINGVKDLEAAKELYEMEEIKPIKL